MSSANFKTWLYSCIRERWNGTLAFPQNSWIHIHFPEGNFRSMPSIFIYANTSRREKEVAKVEPEFMSLPDTDMGLKVKQSLVCKTSTL